MRHYLRIFFGILLWSAFLLRGEAFGYSLSSDMGTIVVTYQTDQTEQAEKHLDRVRFWLINDQQERTLYPKKDEFVSNSHTPNERTVVISNLHPGQYVIEFLNNVEQFFEKIPSRQIVLKSGDLIKIDQSLRLQLASHSSPQKSNELALIVINRNNPFFPYSTPYPSTLYPSSPSLLSSATFSLISNQNVKWKLLLRGRLIYAGMGSVSNISVPPGRGYSIVAEDIPGYTFYTSPKTPFDIAPGQIIRIELLYQKNTPQIRHRRPAPAGQQPNLVRTPRPNINQPNIEEKAPEQAPSVGKGSLQVLTDTPQAIFTLSTQAGAVIGEGKGYQYLFRDLDPGYYLIKFSSPNPDLVPFTSSQNIFIQENQNAQIKASYRKLGRLIIYTQEQIQITLQSSDQKVFKELVNAPSQTLHLPEGRYSFSYQSLTGDQASSKPTSVSISATHPQVISLSGESIHMSKDKEAKSRAGIEVFTHSSQSSFTLEDLNTPDAKPMYFQGKSVFIPLQSGGKFRLVFDPIPNHETPNPISFTREAQDYTYIEVTYTSGDSFVEVPAGIAIIGDPFTDNRQNERPPQEIDIPAFAIGIYEVTNLQYADWLNRAFQEQKVILGNGDQEGFILNRQGQILCKTFEARQSLAQLTVLKQGDRINVMPVPGKESYPVIEVTWNGAQAYCADQGLRLPTEAEWEKAAGMSFPKGHEKAKRFKYGFGQDTIDRTWANYRHHPPSGPIQVLTTPVGFYNGINKLPLTAQDNVSLQTHNAKSPIGAYDMSGNVWEWVAADNQNLSYRIVKGGCYDSLAPGVRVSERLALPPDYSDIYTGFRVATNSRI